MRGTNDHLAVGIGGARQAVLSAAALRCLGGELQGEAEIAFTPQGEGAASVGTRINRRNYFKGAIRQARFTPRALTPVSLIVPEISETTALGAAYLAGIATGTWSKEQVEEMWREAARYEPEMSQDERETLLAEWRMALGVTKSNKLGREDVSG